MNGSGCILIHHVFQRYVYWNVAHERCVAVFVSDMTYSIHSSSQFTSVTASVPGRTCLLWPKPWQMRERKGMWFQWRE